MAPEGAWIWLCLLTSQSGSGEPCLKGLSAISAAAAKPGEPGEAAGALISIGAESNDKQPPDPAERLPEVLISACTHSDIKEERRPRPFYSLLWETPAAPTSGELSPAASVFHCVSPFPRSHAGLDQSPLVVPH